MPLANSRSFTARISAFDEYGRWLGASILFCPMMVFAAIACLLLIAIKWLLPEHRNDSVDSAPAEERTQVKD